MPLNLKQQCQGYRNKQRVFIFGIELPTEDWKPNHMSRSACSLTLGTILSSSYEQKFIQGKCDLIARLYRLPPTAVSGFGRAFSSATHVTLLSY